MLLFAFGGIGGLVNASYSLNLVVHNTAYIVGHFHLTVGTAVTLSFMGITYWFVPVLRGRGLWSPRLALVRAGSGLWAWGCFRLPCMTWASWHAAPHDDQCRGRIFNQSGRHSGHWSVSVGVPCSSARSSISSICC